MNIGVLALQGAFIEHRQMLGRLGVSSFEIRQRVDFEQPLDGLIIPGGESTTMAKLLTELDLLAPIRAAIGGGLAVFGTCAGMILLAQRVSGADRAPHAPNAPDVERGCLGAIDARVRRNAYGRQLGSFSTQTHFKGIGEVPAVFIRAPYIEEAGEQVEVLATVDSKIVAVRQGRALATAFHPELSADTKIHEYFLAMI